ncbi:MAG: hypothetical protein ACRD63_01525 [Pyrinomonadaceae bacterium]
MQQEINLQDEGAETENPSSEQSETGATQKRQITLDDGRYMIFYTFEDEDERV